MTVPDYKTVGSSILIKVPDPSPISFIKNLFLKGQNLILKWHYPIVSSFLSTMSFLILLLSNFNYEFLQSATTAGIELHNKLYLIFYFDPKCVHKLANYSLYY